MADRADRRRLAATGSRLRLRVAGDDRLVELVRRGDPAAFEAVYERHCAELLSFCLYMLRSRPDAEDAVQATFAAAYRAIRADTRRLDLRPWLFTIARNNCLTILRRRRPTEELNGEPALRGDPVNEIEIREEVRHLLDGLRGLPESQRAALVLAEMCGMSQSEIGGVLGVRADQVKAYVYQARSNLISERRARETDCTEIREELAASRGGALLRGRLRRHVRGCADCRVYADGVARQRRQLNALLPLAPSLVLRHRVLEDVLGGMAADPATYASGAAMGGSVAGAAVEVAGGGLKALAVKMAAGVAAVGASAGVGASVLTGPEAGPGPTSSTVAHVRDASLTASAGGRGAIGLASAGSGGGSQNQSVRLRVSRQGGRPTLIGAGQHSRVVAKGLNPDAANATGGGSQNSTRTQERQSKSEERLRKAEERQSAHEERAPRGEEGRRLEREQRRHEREAAGGGEESTKLGGSRSPRSEEERLRRREERKRLGGSRGPRSEEERLRKREERQRRQEEEGG